MFSASRIAWLFAAAIAAMFFNIVMSVLYMVAYGHVIDPGHEPQYYHDHIQEVLRTCGPVQFDVAKLAAHF